MTVCVSLNYYRKIASKTGYSTSPILMDGVMSKRSVKKQNRVWSLPQFYSTWQILYISVCMSLNSFFSFCTFTVWVLLMPKQLRQFSIFHQLTKVVMKISCKFNSLPQISPMIRMIWLKSDDLFFSKAGVNYGIIIVCTQFNTFHYFTDDVLLYRHSATDIVLVKKQQ